MELTTMVATLRMSSEELEMIMIIPFFYNNNDNASENDDKDNTLMARPILPP